MPAAPGLRCSFRDIAQCAYRCRRLRKPRCCNLVSPRRCRCTALNGIHQTGDFLDVFCLHAHAIRRGHIVLVRRSPICRHAANGLSLCGAFCLAAPTDLCIYQAFQGEKIFVGNKPSSLRHPLTPSPGHECGVHPSGRRLPPHSRQCILPEQTPLRRPPGQCQAYPKAKLNPRSSPCRSRAL